MLVIFDLDNTVYDFASAYGGSLLDLAEDIGRVLGQGNAQLGLENLAKEFQTFNSVEYWPIRPPCTASSPSDWHELRNAFRASLRKRLLAYDGMHECISHLRSRGASIVAVSNAPMRAAISRLYLLGFLQEFKHIYAWSGYRIANLANRMWIDDVELESILGRIDIDISVYPSHMLKPSVVMYQDAILGHRPNQHEPIHIVGDSIQRDLQPASWVDVHIYHAAYGLQIDPKHGSLLDSVTPWLKRQQIEMAFAFSSEKVSCPKDLDDLLRDKL